MTEELWHQLPQGVGAKSIALDQFPAPRTHWAKGGKEIGLMGQFQMMQEIVVALRNIRAEMKLDPKKKIAAELYSFDGMTRDAIERSKDGIVRLGLLSDLTISSKPLEQTGGAMRSTAEFDARVAYSDVVDVEAEKTGQAEEGYRAADQGHRVQGETAGGRDVSQPRSGERLFVGWKATLAEQRIELQKIVERLGQL